MLVRPRRCDVVPPLPERMVTYWRPLRVHVTRFERSDTGHAVVVALIEDLTQAKLEQARARETADREFLMRLAFRLSHELKNSLVSIKIFAQLLPERYNEKDFREQFSVLARQPRLFEIDQLSERHPQDRLGLHRR